MLSLVDLAPDIPRDVGRSVEELPDWTLTLSGVHFRYQMRPQQPVLSGLVAA